MAYTSDDLTALQGAIKSGARRVKYSDREVEYRTLTEMRSLAEEMKRQLGLSHRGLRLTYYETRKDL
jgi:hypothetical protein